MWYWLIRILKKPVVAWLNRETMVEGYRRHDFETLSAHVKRADVILVEGRTRVSGVVQAVTLSNWSHSALYVGRVSELPDRELQARLQQDHGWDKDTQLVLEAELGRGTLLSPLDKYRDYHLRICRPHELSNLDGRRMVIFALGQLGTPYDVRQILDLLRFFFPYGLLPRRWRSSLFDYRSGHHTRTVCSTLIAESFASVRFPILPTIQHDNEGRHVLVPKNFRLCTPRDFDNSPYFEIIKYPLLGGNDVKLYQRMHWDTQDVFQTAANEDVLSAEDKQG